MEELSTRWKKLSLSKFEENQVALRIDRKKRDFILAGKFFTRKSLNVKVVAKTFRPLWHAKGGFNVTVGGENILLFAFDLEVDAERVIQVKGYEDVNHSVAGVMVSSDARASHCFPGLNQGFDNTIISFDSHATNENSLLPQCEDGIMDDDEYVSSSMKQSEML
nr:hypothetical protein CFP56_23057 [Quercus suber]